MDYRTTVRVPNVTDRPHVSPNRTRLAAPPNSLIANTWANATPTAKEEKTSRNTSATRPTSACPRAPPAIRPSPPHRSVVLAHHPHVAHHPRVVLRRVVPHHVVPHRVYRSSRKRPVLRRSFQVLHRVFQWVGWSQCVRQCQCRFRVLHQWRVVLPINRSAVLVLHRRVILVLRCVVRRRRVVRVRAKLAKDRCARVCFVFVCFVFVVYLLSWWQNENV